MNATKKIIFFSSVGGALEFYDFIIFAIFTPYISELFFPSSNKLASLLSVYAVFAIGYLIRPLGGIVFSHFGDRYGRKKTFVCSIMVMAIPTFLIGALPTYATAGIWAPILLICMRVLQGFSIGGEIPGALTYTCEHVKSNHRAVTTAIIFAFFNLGIILGSLVSLLLMQIFSHAEMLQWAWRLPFLFGGLLGLVSFQLRKKMSESPIFQQYHASLQQAKLPVIEAIKSYWPQILQGTALTWLSAVEVNLLFIYMPTYLTSILHYPEQQVAWLNTTNLILNGFVLIAVAFIADRSNKKSLLMLGAVSYVVLSYFLFVQINHLAINRLIFSLITISIISGFINLYPALIFDLFPTRIRYTGMALTYNLGFAIFGGLTPLICTFLIQKTASNVAPSIYLTISAGACLLALLTMRKTSKRLELPDAEIA